jgi:hypothetical protein
MNFNKLGKELGSLYQSPPPEYFTRQIVGPQEFCADRSGKTSPRTRDRVITLGKVMFMLKKLQILFVPER